jgi:aminoglycoside phosphotransferase (APT) family kinase protein
MINNKKNDGPTEMLVMSICKKHFLNNETVISVERMLSGNTTFVYRINMLEKTYYARFLQNDGRFNIELLVHKTLLEHNINIPRILFFEEENVETGFSFMIEEEMPGMSLEEAYPKDNELKKILFDAGQQLAQINRISSIENFGVFDVRPRMKLKGEKKSFEEYFFCSFEERLFFLDMYPFTTIEKTYIRKITEIAKNKLNVKKPVLATGDFTLDHIFHMNGQYTGIIDIGKSCGNNRLYDLGYFTAFYQNRTMLGYLLEGYQVIETLDKEDLHSIELMALCVLIKMLGIKAHTDSSSYWYGLMKQQLMVDYII